MKKTLSLIGLMAIIFIGSSFSNASLPWKKLGKKNVTYKMDKDVLRVGANDGTFTKLKIKVTGGSLNMHKMVVEYGNGAKDNIALTHNFKRGASSRVIDLNGGKRVIKDITFWYDTKNNSNQRATVHVFGRK